MDSSATGSVEGGLALPGPAPHRVRRLRRQDAFGPGVLARGPDGRISLWFGYPLGRLPVPTGRLVLADPFDLAWTAALPRRVPSGKYLALAAIQEHAGGAASVGLALRLSEARTRAWRAALPRGRTVEVGSARLALADCGHAARVREATSTAEGLDAWRALLWGAQTNAVLRGPERTRVAQVRVPADGPYRPVWGEDPRGAPTVLVVLGPNLGSFAPWKPPRGQGRPELTDPIAALAWARRAGGPGALVRQGHLGDATIRALVEFAGVALPVPLRRYYRAFTPWTGRDVSLPTWLRAAEAAGLQAGSGAFPVAVPGPSELAVYRRTEDGDRVETLRDGALAGWNTGLASWAVLNTLERSEPA